MKNLSSLTVTILSLELYLPLWSSAEQQPPKGAKALYYDQTSGATVQGSNAGPVHPKAVTSQRTNTGLKYWVELVQPSSTQILRVSSTRAFHSGEHIRLHFESNVDGRIALLQMNPDGSSHVLFPDQRISNVDNHIKAGNDMTIPSGNAWFTFDANPGMERILVFMNPDSEQLTPQPEKDTSSTRTLARNDSGVSSNLLAASSDGKLDAGATAGLAAQVEKEKGSKALVLEVDNKSSMPADYIVKPVAHKRGSAAAQDTLAIEIQLKHQ